MKYKNTKTGAIIDSPCIISGGNWIEIKEEAKEEINTINEVDEAKETKEEEKEEAEENADDFDGITVAQIKQQLEADGIEYNPKALKQELYDLMMQGG